MDPGDDRINLERNNYGHNTIEKNSRRSGGDPETSKERHGKDGGISVSYTHLTLPTTPYV